MGAHPEILSAGRDANAEERKTEQKTKAMKSEKPND